MGGFSSQFYQPITKQNNCVHFLELCSSENCNLGPILEKKTCWENDYTPSFKNQNSFQFVPINISISALSLKPWKQNNEEADILYYMKKIDRTLKKKPEKYWSEKSIKIGLI